MLRPGFAPPPHLGPPGYGLEANMDGKHKGLGLFWLVHSPQKKALTPQESLQKYTSRCICDMCVLTSRFAGKRVKYALRRTKGQSLSTPPPRRAINFHSFTIIAL